ncbi:MAG TPA: DNA-binding response regulator [Clostridiales bacterium]|nr:DNA-binding response regulator [Clostridiales bacterium]
MNILVADDEEIIRKNFIKRINRTQINFNNIYEAGNGVEALSLFQKNKIEIALLDINMPFLNGLKLLERIHNISPDAVIVIISGYNKFEYAQEAIKFGVYRYLLKPVNSDEFNTVIAEAAELVNSNKKNEAGKSLNFQKIMALLKENYKNSEYNLTVLSEQSGLSERHISKIIKKESGKTFSDLLTELRIEQAKRIIVRECAGVKMYEVAEAVGYSNQHYFSRVFKNITGVSPKNYK